MIRYVLALVLIVHGIGHVMGFLEAWTTVNVGFSANPWIFGGNIMIESPLGRVFGLLWLVAMIGFVGAGLGLLGRSEWWPALALASAAISLVAILPWWNTVTSGSQWGATLADLAVLTLLLGPWKDQILRVLG